MHSTFSGRFSTTVKPLNTASLTILPSSQYRLPPITPPSQYRLPTNTASLPLPFQVPNMVFKVIVILPPNTTVSELRRFFASPKNANGGIGLDNYIILWQILN